MLCNYHTHTVRCGHAQGTDREYIEAALAAGVRTLGFSDHAFYRDGGGTEPDPMEEYFASLGALRREYADRLTMYLGFEAEYYPSRFARLLERAGTFGAEYLILGQHALNDGGPDEPYCGRPTGDDKRLDRYVAQCIEGMQTGVFTYLAHPDLLNYQGDEATWLRQMRRLCRAAKDAQVPLEINLHGLAGGRHYPDERVWRIAAEEGNAVLLGVDAHDPDEFAAPAVEAAARELAARCGLTLLEELPLRPLH